MALYLLLNGTSDKIVTPSLTYTEIIIDFTRKSSGSGALQYLVDGRQANSNNVYFYSNGDTGPENFGGLTTAYKNGTTVSNGTEFMAADERMTIRIVSPSQTSQVYFFSRNTSIQFAKSFVFNIKLYNTGVLIAHYDMTTGTVQDQSGNGNHATLTGGTWLDDGVSSGSTIDAGIFSFTGDTTLTANGSLLINGGTVLDANGTLVVDGSVFLNADSSLSGIGSLTADGDILGVSVTANLDAISSLIADGSILVNGGSTLSADTVLNAIPSLIVSGLSSLNGSGTLTADGTAFDPTKQIISKVNLQGEHKLKTLLTTSQDLLVKLNGEVILTIRLVGDFK
jgi:hypothetical protein